MNPVIKAQVSEYAKSGSIKSLKESEKFEVYSIFSILTGYRGESVEALDVHLKGDEFGVDGIALLIQGEVVKNREEVLEKIEHIKNPSIEFVFFQSKTSDKYDYGDASKFFDAIVDFFEGDLAAESTQVSELTEAKDAIYELAVSKRNPSISAFYIATGNYDEPKKIERLKQNFCQRISGMNIFHNNIEVSIVGAKELQKWYRAATTAVEAEIEFPKAVVMPEHKDVEEAYIGYISADQLVKLFTMPDEDGYPVGINKSVFFDNIRDYDPNSKINKEIKDSVLSDGGRDFVFRNNGITVVAKSIDRTGDKFRIEDYQIVNGCQTSNIIYEIVNGDQYKNLRSGHIVPDINIPFRLIGSKEDEFISSIIVGTNRQNPVKEEQFWALRPFMKNFEEYARSVDAEEIIYFERRENQYRGQQVERVRIIQPAVMMKALAACILFQPHRAARDYRGIISEYNGRLFQDEHDVRIYHAACYLHYRLEFLWRNQKVDSRSKTFRFYIICAVGLIVTGEKNVFSMRKNKIESVAKNIINIGKDEDGLRSIVEITTKIIEGKIGDMRDFSQEKVRDLIRSESFSLEFKDSVRSKIFKLFHKYRVE
ncbi:AIPR family protein [Thalassospira permensis]|uniref:AIPR family protein n=1 Tax=Thalassospira permensis TaxID=680197 RepID=UPI00055DE37B|nr:AIPR family protein [Thalassospira permensis]